MDNIKVNIFLNLLYIKIKYLIKLEKKASLLKSYFTIKI